MLRGTLELIIGPMFSGKSTMLLQRIKDLNPTIIAHHSDTRYNATPTIATHMGQSAKPTIIAQSHSLLEICEQQPLKEVIVIDEAHFYTDVYEAVMHLLDRGHHLIVSAIDSDYMARPWIPILKLIPHAHKLHKLYANCAICSNKALYSKRIICQDDEALIAVGGTESYMPVCREHLKKKCIPCLHGGY